jgi:hypothetical protein
MTKSVGTWWIKSGMNDRKKEAESFGAVLSWLPSFMWTLNLGESDLLKKDFIETQNYQEKVDRVDLMYMSSHGSYDPDDSSTWGHAFCTSDGVVTCADSIDWGKEDLEYFTSHACKLLYHSSANSVGRWIPAFKRLHYMFGFHTISNSGTSQHDRGGKFAMYAALHLFIPSLSSIFGLKLPLRTAWKKTCVETEGSSIKWAYMRADGETIAGQKVNTYNETLEIAEPNDPAQNREFYVASGGC